MEHSIYSRHKRLLSAILIGAGALYGQTVLAVDSGIQDKCMEDRAVFEGEVKHLNCTANDINIASASNIVITHIGGKSVEEGTTVCVDGLDVTFTADFDVVSTASARYDIGLYFNREGGDSARNGSCNIYTLDGTNSINASNLDGGTDSCWDVEQNEMVVHSSTITTTCYDSDGDGQLNLPNCVSWRQPGANELCTDPKDAYPGAPSKCNCDDDFNVPIFIQPDPPVSTKTVDHTSGQEPSEEFVYTISIAPAPTTGNKVIVEKIEDIVFSSNSDGAEPYIFVLNGGPDGIGGTISDIGLTQGHFTLMSSGLPDACEDLSLPKVILPTDIGISCSFKMLITDDEIIPDPQLFQNFVRSTIVDEYGSAVGDNLCDVAGTPNCSNQAQVQLVDVPPEILVNKSAFPTSVPESLDGVDVEYTVEITNNSPTHEDVTIISISDDPYVLSAVEQSQCLNEVLAYGESCVMTYTRAVIGNNGDPAFSNTVTVVAEDNEGSTDDDFGQASVSFSDTPGVISIVKTPSVEVPYEATESGEEVTFTYEITNESNVDSVTLTSMVDNPLGTLFGASDLGDCGALLGVTLAPGASVSCSYTVFLDGEPDEPHLNTVTVYAYSDDVLPEGEEPDPNELSATDNGKVVFIDEPADVDLSVDLEITVFLEIENASDYEPVNLNFVKLGEEILSTDIVTTNYEVIANNCIPTVIAASATHTCQFTIDILTFAGLEAGKTLQISVTDEDGGVADEDAVTVKAQLAEPL